jgi:hypothetical protein
MERVDFKITEEDKKDIVKRTYKFALTFNSTLNTQNLTLYFFTH